MLPSHIVFKSPMDAKRFGFHLEEVSGGTELATNWFEFPLNAGTEYVLGEIIESASRTEISPPEAVWNDASI